MAFLSSNERPKKPDVTGSSLGFRPISVPRPGGMSDNDYKNYVKRSQGEEARRIANTRGIDTSGMAWDGEKFRDANWLPRYEDPGFWGPVAITAATLGTGLLASPTGLAGPGTSALTNAPSLAAPTATQTALNTSPYVLGGIESATTGGLTAAQMAAITGASAVPTVATLMNGSQADPANNQPPRPQQNGNAANPAANPPPNDTNTNTNAFQLPLGLTTKDLIGYGSNFFNNYMANRTTSEYNEARAAADKAALDFAMRAYDEQTAKEQARWDATEQRRVPYRAASRDTLAEFRRLLGLGE